MRLGIKEIKNVNGMRTGSASFTQSSALTSSATGLKLRASHVSQGCSVRMWWRPILTRGPATSGSLKSFENTEFRDLLLEILTWFQDTAFKKKTSKNCTVDSEARQTQGPSRTPPPPPLLPRESGNTRGAVDSLWSGFSMWPSAFSDCLENPPRASPSYRDLSFIIFKCDRLRILEQDCRIVGDLPDLFNSHLKPPSKREIGLPMNL